MVFRRKHCFSDKNSIFFGNIAYHLIFKICWVSSVFLTALLIIIHRKAKNSVSIRNRLSGRLSRELIVGHSIRYQTYSPNLAYQYLSLDSPNTVRNADENNDHRRLLFTPLHFRTETYYEAPCDQSIFYTCLI